MGISAGPQVTVARSQLATVSQPESQEPEKLSHRQLVTPPILSWQQVVQVFRHFDPPVVLEEPQSQLVLSSWHSHFRHLHEPKAGYPVSPQQ
jgi:hypothetical protein